MSLPTQPNAKMTAVQNLIASPSKGQIEKAALNGMTLEQVAASEIAANNKEVITNAGCLAVFRDREARLAAFDRIAAIEETDKGSSYIPTEQLIAAILA